MNKRIRRKTIVIYKESTGRVKRALSVKNVKADVDEVINNLKNGSGYLILDGKYKLRKDKKYFVENNELIERDLELPVIKDETKTVNPYKHVLKFTDEQISSAKTNDFRDMVKFLMFERLQQARKKNADMNTETEQYKQLMKELGL